MKALTHGWDTALSRALRTSLTITLRVAVFALVATPLVMVPQATGHGDAFFTPKWAWIATFSLIGFGALLGRALLGTALRFPFSAVWGAAFAFFLWHVVSIAWARSPELAMDRAAKVGWLTLALWVGIHALRSRRLLLGMAWAVLVVGFTTSLWTLVQDFTAAFFPERVRMISNLQDWRGYLTAGLGNTNHLGDFLAVTLLLNLVMFGEAFRRSARTLLLINAVLVAAALTVSYSVGSNIGLFVGALVMLGVLLVRRRTRFFRRRPRRWALLGVLWLLMLALFLIDQPLNPHRPGLLRQGFGSERWIEGWDTRLVIWAGGLEMVRQWPAVGVGAGNFTYVYPEMRSALIEGHPELLIYQGHWTNAAHNTMLQVWAELGIVGLFLFLLMVGAAFQSLLDGIRWARRSEFIMRMTLAGMLAAVLAQSMMNFVLQQPSGAITFYLLLLAVEAEKVCRRGRSRMPPLVIEQNWMRLQVDWRKMNYPTGLGIAFRPAHDLAVALAVGCLVVSLLMAPRLYRPVRAEIAYGRADTARYLGDAEREERYLRRALRLNPGASGIRSRYVEYLLEQERPIRALEELREVRRRLASRELWQREARAWLMLGDRAKADEALREYHARLPPPEAIDAVRRRAAESDETGSPAPTEQTEPTPAR